MTRPGFWLLLAAAAASNGCAALTNPVADGIPIRRLPAEVLGRPKSELRPIPLTVLQQREPDPYRLDEGDVAAAAAEPRRLVVAFIRDICRKKVAPLLVSTPTGVSGVVLLGCVDSKNFCLKKERHAEPEAKHLA